MRLSWVQLIEFARIHGVIIQRSGRNPKYDMWHEKDHGVTHSVDTIDEAVESFHELVETNK